MCRCFWIVLSPSFPSLRFSDAKGKPVCGGAVRVTSLDDGEAAFGREPPLHVHREDGRGSPFMRPPAAASLWCCFHFPPLAHLYRANFSPCFPFCSTDNRDRANEWREQVSICVVPPSPSLPVMFLLSVFLPPLCFFSFLPASCLL